MFHSIGHRNSHQPSLECCDIVCWKTSTCGLEVMGILPPASLGSFLRASEASSTLPSVPYVSCTKASLARKPLRIFLGCPSNMLGQFGEFDVKSSELYHGLLEIKVGCIAQIGKKDASLRVARRAVVP